ncbi:MAG: DUF2281 domain-containing protein [Magnetococcales bacterium]|nr:DUF2281 domain-containing protein [Magnetococcales bacterium]
MSMDIAEKIQHEVRRLPAILAQEVLDFIGYLEYRQDLQATSAGRDEAGFGQAVVSFRGSGKGGGTERMLAERRTDSAREA